MQADIFGFLPQNDGITNARVLQKILDAGEAVEVSRPGIYDVAGTIYLPDHATLRFAPDVVLHRQPDPSGLNGYFFVNQGAFSGHVTRDILISGLTFSVNGVESASATSVPELPALIRQGAEALNRRFAATVFGLRAHLAFQYVKNLRLDGITIPDLADWDYGIQVSDFDTVALENIHIEGNKDAVHFGPGRHFSLRNGVFRTKDDPIALNADDYSPSAPTVGVIDDGQIENCVDLNQDKTYGYFVRFHVGAAVDWKKGLSVTHSDSVICNGRFYRAVLPPDGTECISLTPPTHEKGFALLDGIPWVRTHIGYTAEALSFAATVNNVVLKDLTVEKNRDAAVILYISDNFHHHGWCKDAPVPLCRNITFENLNITGKVKQAFLLCAPVENLVLKNCDLHGGALRFEQGSCGLGKYAASFSLQNVRNFSLDDGSAFCAPAGGTPRYKVKY